MSCHVLLAAGDDGESDAATARSPVRLDHDSSDSEAQRFSPLFSPRATSSTFSEEIDSSVGDESDRDELASLSSLNSPAPSVYSLTESLIQASFRKEFGRDVQNHSEVYHLPADVPEFERLNKQHMMLTWVVGKYPAPLMDVLEDEPQGPQKAVLDLGCGTGAWLGDIAADFPHVDAVGVDLVPPQLTYVPPNVRMEVDDINLGLEHFYGQFDVVNARLISAGIKDYAGLIDQMSRILRPHGLVILSECDFRVYNEDMEPFSLTAPPAATTSAAAASEPPAVARYIGHMRKCIRARGGHVDAASLLHRWVSQHRSFTDVVYRDIYFPLSPFARGDSHEMRRQRKIGFLARDDSLAFMESARPLVLKGGVPEEEADNLLVAARSELMEGRLPCYMRMQCVYARKRT
ncbi:S-adenosyl-L-methionine-dependent methyltransferase [Exidia glandulosa HHB12029]|uniref:S-adenosyl-L-methionine-dependent methyltransferase n=1 Tax=Exidia glandulosa HHB12029 TaxID=1314781 RepID=A0A165NBN1_EXIGL|nr:S-adenosyl-L-methionine-dependent methyltransferase [Exidia glandulosa HHB12029]